MCEESAEKFYRRIATLCRFQGGEGFESDAVGADDDVGGVVGVGRAAGGVPAPRGVDVGRRDALAERQRAR